MYSYCLDHRTALLFYLSGHAHVYKPSLFLRNDKQSSENRLALTRNPCLFLTNVIPCPRLTSLLAYLPLCSHLPPPPPELAPPLQSLLRYKVKYRTFQILASS